MASSVVMTAVAIALMAAVTMMTRLGGYWLMAHVPLTRRMRRMMEALPGSVVVATVMPIAVQGGVPAILAIAAAVLAMVVRRNELMAIAVGVAVAAAARGIGL